MLIYNFPVTLSVCVCVCVPKGGSGFRTRVAVLVFGAAGGRNGPERLS